MVEEEGATHEQSEDEDEEEGRHDEARHQEDEQQEQQPGTRSRMKGRTMNDQRTADTTGAITMTPEQAKTHLAALAAGSKPIATQPIVDQPTAPATKPEPSTPQSEGFVVLNPPVRVYSPKKTNETIRGFVLGSYEDGATDAPFYLLAVDGDLVAVYEAPSLKVLGSLLPNWAPLENDIGNVRAVIGHEVIIDPYRKAGKSWDFVVMSRRVVESHGSRKSAVPSVPPGHPIPEGPAPYSLEAPPARRGDKPQK